MKIDIQNKKTLIIIISLLSLLVILTGITYFLNKENEKTTLTILEKQWIEVNKKNKIDLTITNDISLISNDGRGLFFNFITDFEKDTLLTFNTIPAVSDEPITPYALIRKPDDLNGNVEYIDIYNDHYVYISPKSNSLNNLAELDNLKIGILASDEAILTDYLSNNKELTAYENIETMMEDYDLNFDDILDNKKLDGIILVKNDYLKILGSLKDSYINYVIEDLKVNYILTLDPSNEKFNSIIKKYYAKWSRDNFSDLYNRNSFANYKRSMELADVDVANFKSKRYVYGSVINFPYESVIGQNMVGINNTIAEGFSAFSDVEFSYRTFNTTGDLINAFNNSEIDIMFNQYDEGLLTIPFSTSVSSYDNEQYVIVTGINNDLIIDKLTSVTEPIQTVLNTKINKELTDLGLTTKTSDNYESFLNSLNSKALFAVDANVYDYYKDSKFSKFKVIYTSNPLNYNYIVLKNNENQLFDSLLSYYLTTINNKRIYNLGLQVVKSDTRTMSRNYFIVRYLLPGIVIIALASFIIPRLRRVKKLRNKNTRDSKLKYIDQLTSLKNRTYLKDNMPLWQAATVYPKGIVIIDLNDLKKVNDVHGYAEGDRVIMEAAGILVNNQIANSDILRIDGNEFLLYLVGYDEKELGAYLGRLEKQMKKLPYNYGAAIGYSVITDEITTVEDGINEAYLDMRTNKDAAKEAASDE